MPFNNPWNALKLVCLLLQASASFGVCQPDPTVVLQAQLRWGISGGTGWPSFPARCGRHGSIAVTLPLVVAVVGWWWGHCRSFSQSEQPRLSAPNRALCHMRPEPRPPLLHSSAAIASWVPSAAASAPHVATPAPNRAD